jgi:hypothetical protein
MIWDYGCTREQVSIDEDCCGKICDTNLGDKAATDMQWLLPGHGFPVTITKGSPLFASHI